MLVTVKARTFPIRNGVLVRSAALGLAGGGQDVVAATESLRKGVAAWCEGMRRAGELEAALARHGLKWCEDSTGLTIDIAVDET